MYNKVYRLAGVIKSALKKKINPIYGVVPFVSITRACNAKCLMCPRTHSKNKSSQHMNDEILDIVIETFKRLKQNSMMIHSMGECLMHPNIDRHIDTIMSHGIDVRVSTNAELLDRHMESVSRAKFLLYSLEGWDKDSLKKFRNTDFDRTLHNIKEFYKRYGSTRKTPLVLRTAIYKTMTKDNIRQFVETWGPYVDKINVVLAFSPNLTNENSMPFGSAGENDFMSEFYFKSYPLDKIECDSPFYSPVIQPNGDVLACCDDYIGSLVMGNVTQSSLEEIVQGDRCRRLMDKLKSGITKQCGNCHRFYTFDDKTKSYSREIQQFVDQELSKIK